MYIVTHWRFDDSVIEESYFEFWHKAQQFIDSIGFRFISIRKVV